ncbi:hypothetical protein SUGI_1061230 [Cryptomeria japonica]|uniref:uncharacterized protein LOC131071888 n=1 Tax=Cryptomeria japonica TaxID=3369 RepID=UPI00241478D5|nr:uncharacterized protein LOC131071888 [Cryptomeria japonica]GLJ49915.1 hypothetical protein SUGI_1061230 [Cryptomeria japonica]
MPTPSNHQNMSMPTAMAPHQGQPASPFPQGFMGQGMAQVQCNSVCANPDPCSQQMQMQFRLQQVQMQMQGHGFNNRVEPFAAPGLPNQAPQQPPPPGNGGDSQLHPNSGTLPNTQMFFQSNNMSNPIPDPRPSTHMVSATNPMQNPAPEHAPGNHFVALGIPVPDSTLGTGHSPQFPSQVQLNSLQNPAANPVSNNQMVSFGIPMPNSALGPGQMPPFPSNFQHNAPQMSTNNNMDVATQQFIMSQQLMAAAAAVMHNPALVQAFSCLQGFQNCFLGTSESPLQASNHQTMPLQGSSPSLHAHAGVPSCSVPLHPPRNLIMPMKNTQFSNGVSPSTQTSHSQSNNNVATLEHPQIQAQVTNQQFSSHHTLHATHFNSASFPSGQHPGLFSPFAPAHFMGQSTAEIHQIAVTHSAGNVPFQVGGSTPLHQNHKQLQQAQHTMQPGNLQTAKGSFSEHDGMLRNSCIRNDIQQFQNGACDRGHSSRIGGSRVSPHHGRRTEAGESHPKWKTESSCFNSEQADGRLKNGSPMTQFPPNRIFNNGPSRFRKDAGGGARLHAAALICKTCDRSFDSKYHMEEHFRCHVKCDEENCSFEASGKLLKEHKLVHHGNEGSKRAAPPKSKESVAEIQQWRDERKRNYPIEANIKRKAQHMQERRTRGELIDDDSKIRRERMKEILAKQAELGFPVAEVPSHYLSDAPFHQKGHYKSGTRGNNNNFGKPNRSENSSMKIPRINDLASPRSVLNDVSSFKMEQPREEGNAAIHNPELLCSEDNSFSLIPDKVDVNCKTKDNASQINIKTEDVLLDAVHKADKCQKVCKFFQRGHCLKGQRCTYLHVRGSNATRKGTTVASELPMRATVASKLSKRKPTLLEKLLSGEIKKEKSHLLQIFRFMVNNSFLTEWSNEPLKFFHWTREAPDANPEHQAERQHLSNFKSICISEEQEDLNEDAMTKGVGMGEMESSRDDDFDTDLDEVDTEEKVTMGEMGSCGDDGIETDLDEVDAKGKVVIGEIERRDDNLEEGEIEEGEIV